MSYDAPVYLPRNMLYSRVYVASALKRKKKNRERALSLRLVVPLVKTLMLLKIFTKMQVHLKSQPLLHTYQTFTCVSFLRHIDDALVSNVSTIY